jgi:hypothetical protein
MACCHSATSTQGVRKMHDLFMSSDDEQSAITALGYDDLTSLLVHVQQIALSTQTD